MGGCEADTAGCLYHALQTTPSKKSKIDQCLCQGQLPRFTAGLRTRLKPVPAGAECRARVLPEGLGNPTSAGTGIRGTWLEGWRAHPPRVGEIREKKNFQVWGFRLLELPWIRSCTYVALQRRTPVRPAWYTSPISPGVADGDQAHHRDRSCTTGRWRKWRSVMMAHALIYGVLLTHEENRAGHESARTVVLLRRWPIRTPFAGESHARTGMLTSRLSERTSKAPTSCSAIFSIAPETDCPVAMDLFPFSVFAPQHRSNRVGKFSSDPP